MGTVLIISSAQIPRSNLDPIPFPQRILIRLRAAPDTRQIRVRGHMSIKSRGVNRDKMHPLQVANRQ